MGQYFLDIQLMTTKGVHWLPLSGIKFSLSVVDKMCCSVNSSFSGKRGKSWNYFTSLREHSRRGSTLCVVPTGLVSDGNLAIGAHVMNNLF